MLCNQMSNTITTIMCFSVLLSDYPILLTALKYPSANLTQARERCAQCDMQLCSLAQLKAAYDAGYRNDKWGLVNIQGRDAMVTSCGNRYYASLTECFFRIEGNMASSVIPHTPRPYENAQAFCCRACNMYTGKKPVSVLYDYLVQCPALILKCFILHSNLFKLDCLEIFLVYPFQKKNSSTNKPNTAL